MSNNSPLKVAFVVGAFPSVSHTFIINQVADLLDRGVQVEVFTSGRGSTRNISERYAAYKMDDLTHELLPPPSIFRRLFGAVPKAFRLLRANPRSLLRFCNVARFGRSAWSLRLLYRAEPFAGRKFDVIHCHFGPDAVAFLDIKDVLGIQAPVVTTLYGYDVSSVFRQLPANFYDRLKRECSLFFVMSKNMKKRVVAQGFPEEKVQVLPVSIDVTSYPFCERRNPADKPIELVSVGRFVEKKGFDDLLRALAIVRRKTNRSFRCSVIGGGTLEQQIHDLARSLGLKDVVDFTGPMSIDEIMRLLMEKHIMVQPSKTAANGDME